MVHHIYFDPNQQGTRAHAGCKGFTGMVLHGIDAIA